MRIAGRWAGSIGLDGRGGTVGADNERDEGVVN